MHTTHAAGAVADPASRPTAPDRGLRRLLRAGALATLAAVLATTLAAALAAAAGVDFDVAGTGETVPPSGFAVVTAVFCVLGVALAAGFRRWSVRPAERFLRTAVALTAVSLVPPFLSEADAAATAALVGLHLLAAAVAVPVLTRALGPRTG